MAKRDVPQADSLAAWGQNEGWWNHVQTFAKQGKLFLAAWLGVDSQSLSVTIQPLQLVFRQFRFLSQALQVIPFDQNAGIGQNNARVQEREKGGFFLRGVAVAGEVGQALMRPFWQCGQGGQREFRA